MNLKNHSSAEELKKLIAPCDDEHEYHILAVSHSSEVIIESYSTYPLVKVGKYLFYYLFHPGHGYTGYSASRDNDWVNNLYEELNYSWANGNTGRISISTLVNV